jgi:DGQHR domain-containing protein
MTDLDEIADEILSDKKNQRAALALLLTEAIKVEGRILVQKTRMGKSEAYLGSMTLEKMTSKFRYAHQLPLFQKYVDEDSGKLVIDDESIEELQQRPLDWSRQAALTQYLATHKNHKFPPILAVITQPWVENPESDEWGVDGRALSSSVQFTALDETGLVGLMSISDDSLMYALDGQHRLMGAFGLMDLIRSGRLERKSKDNKGKSSFITVESLEEEYQVGLSNIQNLGTELLGVEFIAAVVAGETREEAKQRVRSIFVHVNTMSAPLSKSQTDQLDEDNGFAIVARKAAVTHQLLRGHTEWNKTGLTEKAEEFTTLHTLKDMAHHLLENQFKKWEPLKDNPIPMRPDDSQLAEGLEIFKEFLTHLNKLPSIEQITQGATATKLRQLPPGGSGHILGRPVAQMALADAIGDLTFGSKKMPMAGVFDKLTKLDESGRMSHLNEEKSIWYGVLWDPYNQKILLRGRSLAKRLFAYLLGGGIEDDDQREALRKDFADARATLEDDDTAKSLEGETVKRSEVSLPNVIH